MRLFYLLFVIVLFVRCSGSEEVVVSDSPAYTFSRAIQYADTANASVSYQPEMIQASARLDSVGNLLIWLGSPRKKGADNVFFFIEKKALQANVAGLFTLKTLSNQNREVASQYTHFQTDTSAFVYHSLNANIDGFFQIHRLTTRETDGFFEVWLRDIDDPQNPYRPKRKATVQLKGSFKNLSVN